MEQAKAKKSNNNLYTFSYFKKRLVDSGYTVTQIYNSFSANPKDARYWMCVIQPGKIIEGKNSLPIVCTCFKSYDEVKFLFSDGNQKIVWDKPLVTKSMLVIVNYVNEIFSKPS